MPLEIDLGVTATREGLSIEQDITFRRLARLFYGQFHEGDAIGGDADATKIIDELEGYFVHVHPPTNKKYRAFYTPKSKHRIWEEKFYGERDLDIVKESDVMVGCPNGWREIKRGSGTWLTIRMARAELRPLAIIYPDGTIEYERWPKMLPQIRR